MMKNVLLTAIVGTFAYAAMAQCTPDASYDPQSESGAGISPLECAVVNQAYTGVATIVIPPTTEYVMGGNTLDVYICKIRVDDLTNMPTSVAPINPTVILKYGTQTKALGQTINMESGVDRGCVTFNGTFTQVYNDTIFATGVATVSLSSNCGSTFDVPFSLLNDPGLPIAFKVQNTQAECDGLTSIEETISNNSFDVAQNFPNPFNGESQIAFNLPENGKVTFRVTNLVGKIVKDVNVNGNAGMNYMTVSSDEYAAGVYMYSISFGGKTITKRMIIK